MILVDSNVWIDLIQQDPEWHPWSLDQVLKARAAGPVAINAVIYAELAPTYDRPEALATFLRAAKARLCPISPAAAFLAGHAFVQYRRRKGSKTGVLPDFFIGAQAQAEGWTLLTRDAARYKTYFPAIQLICPH